MTWRERPVVFGRHNGLLGVLTLPTVPAGTPVVILGAGILHRVGPSRISVQLARRLAAGGHPVIRFDLSSIGDSARAPEAQLADAATADIGDAISTLLAEAARLQDDAVRGVYLVGFCSGADNAFHVAAGDARVIGAVLFDPTVPRTPGFHRRKLAQRLTSSASWWNVVSGRAIRRRIADRGEADEPRLAPDHYGLLTTQAEVLDASAVQITSRGARVLFVLSQLATQYCNSAEQVAEAMPTACQSGRIDVAWEMSLDHVLSTTDQTTRFIALVQDWLLRVDGPE